MDASVMFPKSHIGPDTIWEERAFQKRRSRLQWRARESANGYTIKRFFLSPQGERVFWLIFGQKTRLFFESSPLQFGTELGKDSFVLFGRGTGPKSDCDVGSFRRGSADSLPETTKPGSGKQGREATHGDEVRAPASCIVDKRPFSCGNSWALSAAWPPGDPG